MIYINNICRDISMHNTKFVFVFIYYLQFAVLRVCIFDTLFNIYVFSM